MGMRVWSVAVLQHVEAISSSDNSALSRLPIFTIEIDGGLIAPGCNCWYHTG